MKLPAPLGNLLARLGFKITDRPVDGALRKTLSGRLSAEQNELEGEITARCYLRLLEEAASPLSQMLLQLQLGERADSTLSASDVLVHAKRLITIFEQNGMQVIGKPGELLPFDPSAHELADGSHRDPGDTIYVRFPGIAYESKLVRKAFVESRETP